MGGDQLEPQNDDGKELVQGVETRNAEPLDLDHADVVENDAPTMGDTDEPDGEDEDLDAEDDNEDDLDSDSDLDDGDDHLDADEDEKNDD